MSDETIVAIYDTAAHAQQAAADLRATGVPENAISLHANSASGTTTAQEPREQGFWSSLFGGAPDHDTTVYDRSVDSGATVLSVKTPNEHVTRVLQILESHNPVDIDERAKSYGQTAAMTTEAPVLPVQPPMAAARAPEPARDTAPAARRNDDMMQLSEESLNVSKRVVNRGGTRIRRFVVERPVEESVNLQTEKVVLERNPVSDARPSTDSFTDRTIEMSETAEEAVVSKSAHVYEEVGLRKEATDRVETVRDTLRKEEVEVVKIPGVEAPEPVVDRSTPRG